MYDKITEMKFLWEIQLVQKGQIKQQFAQYIFGNHPINYKFFFKTILFLNSKIYDMSQVAEKAAETPKTD